MGPGVGDVGTWTAICADTKLVLTWLLGGRDAGSAELFMRDLAGRLANRVQLTTDGYRLYLNAVDNAVGGDLDYAELAKLYGPDANDRKPEAKYTLGTCNGLRR